MGHATAAATRPRIAWSADPQLVTLTSHGALSGLVAHLWSGTAASQDHRIMLNAAPDPAWQVLHHLRVVPSAQRSRLLISSGSRRGTARALAAFQGLRFPVARLGRQALAAAAVVGVPLGRDRLTVERRPGTDPSNDPISHMERVIGEPLLVVLGVRTGANAKATLQMFDCAGVPRGYAKLAWNPLTSAYVRTETTVLTQLQGGRDGVRVPKVVTSGEVGGHPYLVTSPLPGDVRRPVRGSRPSIGELHQIAPFSRRDRAGATAHLGALAERLHAVPRVEASVPLVGQALRLHRALLELTLQIPVATRWHGDLVPWNTARDTDGTLWVWDWETAEADAVCGLDVLHWVLNTDRRSVDDPGGGLAAAVSSARPELTAMGAGPRESAAIAAVYALCLAERGITLAAAHGGWQHNRLSPDVVADIIGAGLQQATRAGAAG